MVFFRKNKRHFTCRSHRNFFVALFLFLVFGVSGAIVLIMNVNAQTAPVKSIEIKSARSNFDNGEPGAWKITKSAEWIDAGKARITFKIDSIAKYDNNKKLDIVMVIDNSASMSGNKMTQVKADATDLADTLLSDSDNKIALISFNSSAQILSGLSNNKQQIIDLINGLNTPGSTNYYDGLLKAEEVLNGYTLQEGRELILLFLTDGFPNEETPNEVAQYEALKAKYPYMVINGVQYEMGEEILQPIIDVSDNQYIANMDSLNNVLYEATVVPYTYDDFTITDYINNDHWTVSGLEAISTRYGNVILDNDGTVQTITWDLHGYLHSGDSATMIIDIELRDDLIDQPDLLLPTNTHEVITSSLLDTPNEDLDSALTPILKSAYEVTYEANAPTGCEIQGTVPAMTNHTVFTAVEIQDNELSCTGYHFKGWQIATPGVTSINNDYFRMPEKNVLIRAVWAKLDISKSMDGGTQIKATATFDTGQSVNVKMKNLSGQASTTYQSANSAITTVVKADTLSNFVDMNDSQYILSSSNSMVPIYGWYDNGTIYYYSEAEEVYLNANSRDMFNNMRSITNIDLSECLASRVVNMVNMFYQTGYNAQTFSLDLSGWDTSSVTSMNNVFYSTGYSATTWSIGDLSSWDTSSVTNMGAMFYQAGYSATTWSIGDLSSWDTSNVTSMGSMFFRAGYNAQTFSLDLSGWNTSSVMNMSNMFSSAGYKATTWSIEGLSGWNTSSVTTMSSMFSSAGYSAQTFSLDLSGWNTSNVTQMFSMFYQIGYSATTWSIGDLSGWDTSNVTSMSGTFNQAGYSATTWSIGDLSGWNTSNVTDMGFMFSSAGYKSTTWSIGYLSGWKTSSVNNMSNMFYRAGYNAQTFRLNLSAWNTSSVTNMSNMFDSAGCRATTWSIGTLSGWNTSKVTNMSSMFKYAGYNTQILSLNLSRWNTSSVTNMSNMFDSAGYKATTWSIGTLSGWNTSKVTTMSDMFYSAGYNAQSFNLNLSGWNTSKVTNMSSMFSRAGNSATTWAVTIPSVNGAGIANTASNMYGNTTSVTATPPSGKAFTLATP